MLTKACLNVLKKDKELLLFPVLCGVMTVLVTAGFCFPAWKILSGSQPEDNLQPLFALLGVSYSFVTYSVIIFFNVAVLACAKKRFEGGDPTLSDGFQAGFSNLGVIFAWAAVGGLVSLIIRQLEENLGFLGAIFARMLGSAFAVVSFFAIPVMVFEKKGPVDAFKRSGEVIKKTWGEALGAYLGFSVLTTIVCWLVIFSLIGSVATSVSFSTAVPLEIWGGVSLILVLVTAIVSSCLNQIFQAALYIYATTGEIPSELGEEMLTRAFVEKSGRKWKLV